MSLYGRIWARIYDREIEATERAGLGEMTREALSAATGRVLEIGAGSGRNLKHYPDTVDELVLSEPDPDMARLLEPRVASRQGTSVVIAPGEALPFEDESFDTVVCALVLCTVPDLPGTLAEARRVLRPGGLLLFIEHVRSDSERLSRWQDRLAPAWKAINRGCHCNRETLAAIEAAGYEVVRAERRRMPRQPPLVKPMVLGAARRG